MHADLKIGDSHVMLAEASEQHPAMQSMVHLYVPNVDAVYQRAVAAGGKSCDGADGSVLRRPRRRREGSRPADHWYIATHIEDVSMAELKKRADEMYKQQKGKAA